MKNFRKILTIGAVVLAMGVTSVVGFAASNYDSPAEAVAGLTGRTVESVVSQRQEENTTYGQIASDAGKLDEFKKESLEMKKDNLKSQVEAGRITQEKADEILKAIEENQGHCDGTGSGKIGQGHGARFGSNGEGQGLRGSNRGQGHGHHGQGQGGMRLQDGTCHNPNR